MAGGFSIFGIPIGGSLSHDSNSTKNSTGLDQWSQNYLQGIGQAGQQAAQQGPGPLLTGAGQYGTNLQNGGNLGLSAMSGDPNAMSQLMNPYQQQVIGAQNSIWQQINAQTANQVNQQATQNNAFGGSRQGVAQGVALAQNNLQQANQTAQLLQSGYQNAVQQAQGLAGFGLQGAQLNSNLGFGGVGNGLWGLNALRGGFVMPTGQNSDTEQHQTGYGGGFGG